MITLKELIERSNDETFLIQDGKVYVSEGYWSDLRFGDEVFNLNSAAPVDKSDMMLEIYMEGVNMSGEYQGCWIRFKDIEKIVNKYM